MTRRTLWLLAVVCAGLWPARPSEDSLHAGPVIRALQQELARSMQVLSRQPDPAYFLCYEVSETSSLEIEADMGALRSSRAFRSRYLDVDVRIGNYDFDNTHQIRGTQESAAAAGFVEPLAMPLDDDDDALKSLIWLRTDRLYRAAVERWIQVQANRTVKAAEETSSPDFSREPVRTAVFPLASLAVPPEEWAARVRRYSAMFRESPGLLEGSVSFSAHATNKYIVNSEGTSVQCGTTGARLIVLARTRAEDGMDLYRVEAFDSHSAAGIPGDDTVRNAVQRMVRDLEKLRRAPVIEPYTGPAILSGRAAGVFFHEIFGHRIEGQRQKNDNEGQTFSKQIGKGVLPEFLTVVDDPTAEAEAGADLNGYYRFDDEGVPAAPVTIVDGGILKNFLLSRLPAAGFEASNGHGRKAPGYRAVGRQANLIVRASRTVPDESLRQMLVDEVRKQGKPFGLLFSDISGGFTTTVRSTPQTFQVTPIMVYRVYPDGRPDELVRGVDLIGTPLVSFSRIVAAGDRPEVFNGYCGAESGSVPVSAVSPAILTSQIEVQKKPNSSDRVPILPPPPVAPEGARP